MSEFTCSIRSNRMETQKLEITGGVETFSFVVLLQTARIWARVVQGQSTQPANKQFGLHET
jgi:hypothetical protein